MASRVPSSARTSDNARYCDFVNPLGFDSGAVSGSVSGSTMLVLPPARRVPCIRRVSSVSWSFWRSDFRLSSRAFSSASRVTFSTSSLIFFTSSPTVLPTALSSSSMLIGTSSVTFFARSITSSTVFTVGSVMGFATSSGSFRISSGAGGVDEGGGVG